MWKTGLGGGWRGKRFHNPLWETWLHMWISAGASRLSTANPPARGRLFTVHPQAIHMARATVLGLAVPYHGVLH